MKFLASSHTSSQLEELNRICTVSHRLIALRTHLSRTFQRVVFLPVLLARCLFHQHKRLVFQSPHQIMFHGDHAPRSIISRIVIPGYDIHLFCPFEIIQIFESSHQICSDHYIRIMAADRISFHFIALQHAVGVKSTIIDRNSCKCGLFCSNSLT